MLYSLHLSPDSPDPCWTDNTGRACRGGRLEIVCISTSAHTFSDLMYVSKRTPCISLTNFSDFCVSTVKARVSLRALSGCVSVCAASAAPSAGSSINGFCDFIILISPKSSSGSASASNSRQSVGSRMTREKIKSLVKGRKSGSGFRSTAGMVLVSYFSCIENPFRITAAGEQPIFCVTAKTAGMLLLRYVRGAYRKYRICKTILKQTRRKCKG